MVGILRKAKQVLSLIKQYSPFLNQFIPGLGEMVGTLSGVADSIMDGANNVYEDYQDWKNDPKGSEKYGFTRGVKSFFKPKPSAANTLSKDYGGIHPRLKLKDDI
jgi:hypothetical protein